MSRLAQGMRILMAALREVFDEAPYQRFLLRNKVASSPAAYAAFWREREASQQRRPRCC